MNYAILAQVATDVIKPIAEVGWPGVFLWVVVTRLDRLENAMKDLSTALWAVLASSPTTEHLVTEEAKDRLSKLRSEKSR